MDVLNNQILEPMRSFFENKTVTLVATLLLALYAALAAPALPNKVIMFFDTIVGRLLFIFLIAFVASRNVQVALMIAVAYVVTLSVLNQRYAENFANAKSREHFEDAKKAEASKESKGIKPVVDMEKSLEVAVANVANGTSTAVKNAVCFWVSNLSELSKPTKKEAEEMKVVDAMKEHAEEIAKSGTGITTEGVRSEASKADYKDKTVKAVCEEQKDITNLLSASAHEGFNDFQQKVASVAPVSSEVEPNDASSLTYAPAEF
jgi:hypothetical protein